MTSTGTESDKALALLAALDESQRKQAILDYHVGDLVLERFLQEGGAAGELVGSP